MVGENEKTPLTLAMLLEILPLASPSPSPQSRAFCLRRFSLRSHASDQSYGRREERGSDGERRETLFFRAGKEILPAWKEQAVGTRVSGKGRGGGGETAFVPTSSNQPCCCCFF